MPLDKSKIKKILVVSLTNIGDVILTFPVIDILRQDFPNRFMKIVVGPKAVGLFKNNPYLQGVDVFDKHQSKRKTIRWVCQLFKERYDLVVDLRNTAIPLFLFPSYRTSMFRAAATVHMKDKHLMKLKTIYPYDAVASKKYSFFIPEEEKKNIQTLLDKELGSQTPFVVVAPGAASRDKRWSEEGFAVVCDELIKKYKLKTVFVGDWEDKKISCRIIEMMEQKPLNLCGETNLIQLGEIIRQSKFSIVNDSAPMHLASYLNVPVLAIFGPSNPTHYGPWSSKHIVISNNVECFKCLNPTSLEIHRCMQSISTDEVLGGINNLMQMIS